MAGSKSFNIFFLILNLLSILPLRTISFSPDRPTGRRILVLLDDLSLKSSHSLFFSSLQSRGYDLDFKLADDPTIAVKRYGQYFYDGLIIFSPSIDRFGGSLDVGGVLDFVDSGHDLVLAADSNASDLIRNIAAECGVDFEEGPTSMVIDHSSYAVSETEGDHTLIAADDFIQSEVILGSKQIGCKNEGMVIERHMNGACIIAYAGFINERCSTVYLPRMAPVLFKGIGHSLNPENSLVLKVLSASPSAYSANPNTKLSSSPSLTGTAISLVSIVQARNNARIMISGSLNMFSNRLFRSGVQKAGNLNKYVKSGNEQFVTELSKWIFHERGHLKSINIKHNKVGEKEEPQIYRINDDLEFSVEIFEWSGTSWVPYVANDVQLQFYMMSPYVLKTLSTDRKGKYHTSFKVPDVYGVFQFKIEYQRLGYTSLSLSKQIPVRPFRHNEYERFIVTAFPYYGASFSMMAGFFIFSFIYLYHK